MGRELTVDEIHAIEDGEFIPDVGDYFVIDGRKYIVDHYSKGIRNVQRRHVVLIPKTVLKGDSICGQRI